MSEVPLYTSNPQHETRNQEEASALRRAFALHTAGGGKAGKGGKSGGLKAEIEVAIGEAVREAASLCEEMCSLLESDKDEAGGHGGEEGGEEDEEVGVDAPVFNLVLQDTKVRVPCPSNPPDSLFSTLNPASSPTDLKSSTHNPILGVP